MRHFLIFSSLAFAFFGQQFFDEDTPGQGLDPVEGEQRYAPEAPPWPLLFDVQPFDGMPSIEPQYPSDELGDAPGPPSEEDAGETVAI